MPDGLYQYTVMPFGIKNALATYQQMINTVLSGVQGCGAYCMVQMFDGAKF